MRAINAFPCACDRARIRQAFEQYSLSDRPWPALIVNYFLHTTQLPVDGLRNLRPQSV